MNKSLLGFRMSPLLQDEVAALLDGKNISYVKKPKRFLLTVDREMIDKQKDVFRAIAAFVKRTWEADG